MMMQAFRSNVFARFFTMCVLAIASTWVSGPAWAQVIFDVNAIVPARTAEQYGLLSRMPNSRFVELQLETSALFQAGTSASVTEVTVRVASRHEDVIVADYSPRTELQSDVFGSMQVALDNDRMRESGLQGIAGYPGLGTASGFAYQMDSGHQSVQFARKPALELVIASGTLARQHGVYFKMRQSSQTTLEGARNFRIVFEVPENWRADLLDVQIEAVGLEHPKARRTTTLSSQPFVVAVYQEGDDVAGRVAANYHKQQAGLIQISNANAWTIQHRNFPTPFHKLGAKLDIYEPGIPQGWLDAIVYQPGVAYHVSKLSMLPVDVRVALMNFIDQKSRMESLSGTRDMSQRSNESQVAQESNAFVRR